MLECIFCDEYKTQIEFDLDLHLYEMHRWELLTEFPLKGRGYSMDYRIAYVIDTIKTKEKQFEQIKAIQVTVQAIATDMKKLIKSTCLVISLKLPVQHSREQLPLNNPKVLREVEPRILPEYKIRPTFVRRQPSIDFIVMMHPSDMKELKIRDNDFIKLENIIRKQEEEKKIELLGLVVNSEHKYSKMTRSDHEPLKPGEIGIDQTYREALALTIGNKVVISKTNTRQNLKERFLSLLNYQKAIVRIQANAPYMEHKIPVVCLCDEMMSSIGAEYGDMVNVESTNNKIIAKTAKLTTSMQQFHDFVLDKSNEDKVKPRLTERYFLDPLDFGVKSERLQIGDLIHPIFMDAIAMNLLSAGRLHPVKIYRSFWWDVQKKLNSFGSVSLLAFSVTLGLFIQKPSIVLLVWSIILGAWGSWSVVTSSLYKTKTEKD